jgi:class 3 adenylate cyclase/tetratricopeptide (TPR) repeat protein
MRYVQPVEQPSRAPGRVLDNLQAHIPGDRRRALASGVEIDDRVHGAALFADISGFTPLTDALAKELGPQRGAEELTGHLNRVFQRLIDELNRFGGHVIFFGGDAITCWLDEDDGVRAAACGLAMQRTMNGLAEVVTPSGTRVRLAMKAAVAVGAARRFVVGDPDVQLMDVLAGRLVDALARAERLAEKGEVVLERNALESLGARAEIAELRSDGDGVACAVLRRVAARIDESPHRLPHAGDLPVDTVKAWLLPAIHQRLSVGRGEFLAELRPAFPLFIRFGGIDYDADDAAPAKLDAFVRAVQRILVFYGGSLLHLSLGDKGAYLYAVFGSPLAHEDDAARATAAALELRELQQTTAATGLQIGIAHGRLHSGMYGHAERQAFTCLGDAVNVAARLMSHAPPNRILVTEAVRSAAGDAFVWEALPPLAIKGKPEPVPVFALTGSRRRAARGPAGGGSAIVGRAAELDALRAALDDIAEGRGRVTGISGDAGIGKSRLIAAFVVMAKERPLRVAIGECQSYGRHVGYFVWRNIWSSLFRIDDDRPAEDRVNAVTAALAAIDPVLAARAPLLSGLLDLPIPDNDLTASFDAKLRKTSLEALLVDCLRAEARAGPLVLVLEDCHWIDALSRDLLEALARSISELPVLIVVAYRPGAEVGASLGIERFPRFTEIALAELEHPHSVALIRARLGRALGTDADPPAALVDLITARAQGNPFYIEELFNFITSQGVDPRDESALKKLELPDSVHSLILSRVDNLAEAPRQILKVASVIGRVFQVSMLPGVYPELGGLDAIREHLHGLGAADLVRSDEGGADTYLFKHVVTREVAYESMPFGFRSLLHERVGRYIEDAEADALERNLDLLAYHYWHSDVRDKKREYLGRAGAAAQAAYANATAIDYYERLAPLLSKGSRLDVLLKLGKVLELVGNWHRAEEVDAQALAIADDLDDGLRQAACQTALAEVVRKQGRYDDALELLNAARRGFASFGEETGVARVLHFFGTVWAQRGDYDRALENYNKSLAIRERIGDKASMASLLSNLGVIAEYRGDYERSREFHQRALALRESVGDRWPIGVSMNNLGMIAVLQKRYDEACEWFGKSMRLNREVGDAWMVAICNNNLGNALRGLGDYAAARAHYADSLRAYRDYDDRWALAFLLEDIGVLAVQDGRARAGLELLGAADALREAIGAPRAPSLAEEIARQLAVAAAKTADEDLEAWRASGRTLDVATAVERAFTVCAAA